MSDKELDVYLGTVRSRYMRAKRRARREGSKVPKSSNVLLQQLRQHKKSRGVALDESSLGSTVS